MKTIVRTPVTRGYGIMSRNLKQKLTHWKVDHPGAIPASVKSAMQLGMRATSRWRSLPNFLVIGFQKCSTTSLFSYLALHPEVRVSLKKEINYFGCDTGKDLDWYRSHFPIDASRLRPWHDSPSKYRAIGEASTIYAFSPTAPGEARAFDPNLKIVAVVRDPVARTISHYYHRRKNNREHRPIDEAIGDAIDRRDEHLRQWNEAASGNPNQVYEEPFSSYLIRSMYSIQIENWRRHFSAEQIMLISAKDLSDSPGNAFARVEDFLGVSRFPLPERKVFNQGRYNRERLSIEDRLGEALAGELAWCRDEGLCI